MSWANKAIQDLKENRVTKIRPHGNSMSGKINSGDLVTLCPVDEASILEVNNIVLTKVKGQVYLHLIKAIKSGKELYSEQYLIGNNHGRINGWTTRKNIYGIVESIEK